MNWDSALIECRDDGIVNDPDPLSRYLTPEQELKLLAALLSPIPAKTREED